MQARTNSLMPCSLPRQGNPTPVCADIELLRWERRLSARGVGWRRSRWTCCSLSSRKSVTRCTYAPAAGAEYPPRPPSRTSPRLSRAWRACLPSFIKHPISCACMCSGKMGNRLGLRTVETVLRGASQLALEGPRNFGAMFIAASRRHDCLSGGACWTRTSGTT